MHPEIFNKFSPAIFICLLFLAVSCTDTATNSESDPVRPVYPDVEWQTFALDNTLIIKSFMDAEENIYAFTGLEVLKAPAGTTSFEEITALNNRRFLLYQQSSSRIISLLDSTMLYSTNGGIDFISESFGGLIFRSVLTNDNSLVFSSQSGDIFSYHFSTAALDTLYLSDEPESTFLISQIEDFLYLRNQNQIKRMSLSEPDEAFTIISTPTNRLTELIKLQNGTLLAGTERQYVLRSTDNGESWDEIKPGQIIANTVTDLEVDDNGKVYVSFLGSGIYQYLEEEQNWEIYKNDNLDFQVFDISLHPAYEALASTSAGLYFPVTISEQDE